MLTHETCGRHPEGGLTHGVAGGHRKPKLGTGKRFEHLEKSLASKGAHDPGALAAYIGRQKFGDKKMAKLSQHKR